MGDVSQFLYPVLTITDGNPGTIQAVEEVFPWGLGNGVKGTRWKTSSARPPRRLWRNFNGRFGNPFAPRELRRGSADRPRGDRKIQRSFPGGHAALGKESGGVSAMPEASGISNDDAKDELAGTIV